MCDPTPIYRVPATYPEMGGDQRDAAAHEAGHTIVALSFGSRLVGVRIGDYPMCCTIPPEATRVSPLGTLIELLAGSTCEGILARRTFILSDRVKFEKIAQARAGGLRVCDRCREAKILIENLADASDDDICKAWEDAAHLTFILLRHHAFRRAARAMAIMLRRRGAIFGEEVSEIVDIPALIAARDEVMKRELLGTLENLL
jgi:hypothetical protein